MGAHIAKAYYFRVCLILRTRMFGMVPKFFDPELMLLRSDFFSSSLSQIMVSCAIDSLRHSRLKSVQRQKAIPGDSYVVPFRS